MKAGADIRELAERLVATVRADVAAGRAILSRMESIASEAANPSAQAFCLRAHGNILQVEGKLAEAVAEYRLALPKFQEGGEQVEAARTASSLVGALAPLGEFEEALRLADYARTIFSAAGLNHRLGRLNVNVGNIYHRLGRLDEALNCYETAATILIASGDDEAAAGVLINSAVLLMLLYRFKDALEGFDRATAFCASRGMNLLTTQSEYNRGYLLYLMGRSLDALRVLQSVEKEFEIQGDEFNAAQSRLDRADILLELNLAEHAAGLAAAAEAAFSRLGASSDHARALLVSGRCALKKSDLARASSCFEGARSIFHREGNMVWGCLVDLERASVSLARGEVESASSLASSASETLRRGGHGVFAIQAELIQARIRMAQGDIMGALRVLEQPPATKLPAWLDYQREYLRGRALELSGDRPGATASYVRAVEILEFLGSNVFVDDVMLRFSADKPDAYLRLVALTEDDRLAFDYLERFRSRMLPSFTNAPNAGDLSSEVRDIRQALRAGYLELLQKPAGSDARSFDRIREIERQLEERIREHRIALQGTARSDAASLRPGPEEDATIIEYLVDGDAVQAFVVNRNRLERIRLRITPAELERQVAFVHHYLQSKDEASRARLDRHLIELYEGLLAPLEGSLTGRVVFVPDGCLRDLPFHALRAPWGTVLDRCIVWYAPSAASYLNAQGRSRNPDNVSVLIGLDSPGIPSVRQELQAVASNLPNPVICTGPEIASLPETFSRAAFIHIASHGVFRRDDPSFSMLLLGSDVLTPADIANMKLEAELVTLSACSTGRVLAPGIQGFLRAFLVLGVPSLVGSLWDVDDSSTAKLMGRFYSNLLRSADLAVALREAMLDLKAGNDHPYHWAAFVLVGRSTLKDSWKFFQNRCTELRTGETH